MVNPKEYLKHFAKILLFKKDLKLNFVKFENKIHKNTWANHDIIIKSAEEQLKNKVFFENEKLYSSSNDPLIKQTFELTKQLKSEFFKKYSANKEIKILIHVPTVKQSVAGFSLFNNLIEGLNYIGINTNLYYSGNDLEKTLNEFQPTIFLTSDNSVYRKTIDWTTLKKYRNKNKLKLGLTASLEEYGNTSLVRRLKWAKENDVNFYYSFRDENYINSKIGYMPFFYEGYKIVNIEFGANPLIFYPIPNILRDINYVFLGSSNPDKRARYSSYLTEIFMRYPGFIDGPNWAKITNFKFNKNRDRYIYSRAKVGINLHINSQIDDASELNERTYMLAACGVPQLIDNPKLLNSKFEKDSFFIANNPKEYLENFEFILKNKNLAEEKALFAQKQVFQKYSSFHIAEKFILTKGVTI